MKHYDEASRIWREHVPKSGQADSVQGELLRAVEKLRDEAIRNGNINWDDDFEILLSYLEDKLLDASVYSASSISETRKVLMRLHNFEEPLLDDGAYDELGDRVVEYFQYYGSQPHPKNALLLR